MWLDTLLELALNASKKASKAILDEQKSPKIWHKKDGTPLSSADLLSNEILCDELLKSDIAVCSEEKPLNFDERKNLPYFWLIDPLDGTKGFLKGSNEFCILIALIAHKRPILSVITQPSVDESFYAHIKSKVYKNDKVLVSDESTLQSNKKLALISVHHPNAQNETFLNKNKLKALQISSALKFTALLEGKAGVYHRFECLHSWDIAAGDFLLHQNGGFMGDLNKKIISYNEKSFLAPPFIAVSKQDFAEEIIF